MQATLTLDVGIGRWTYFSIRSSDAKFEPIAAQIYKRDDFTCRYCSFRAIENMSVVNLNKNYLDNSLPNLITSCPLCTQCLFIEMVGKNGCGGGQLIHLPEMSQNDLNGLCHAIFCALSLKSTSQSKATDLYNSLKLRAQAIEKQWGSSLSDPAFMGQMLIDTPGNTTETNKDFLSSLRLLPNYDSFSDMINIWIESSTKKISRAL